MTDRELLELAAKAVGLKVISYSEGYGLGIEGDGVWWNPLGNDGQAMRLLASIARTASFRLSAGKTFHSNNILLDIETSSPKAVSGYSVEGDDEEVAKSMRRMAVSVAAQIGKRMA